MKKIIGIILLIISVLSIIFVYNNDFLYTKKIIKITKIEKIKEEVLQNDLGLNEKYMSLYDYLIQASLFSENGISTQELMSYLHISRATVSNRLSSISENGLLIKNASGNIRYYKLNLDKTERFHKE